MSGKAAIVWTLVAISSFHTAYIFPQVNFVILVFLFALFQLRNLNSGRKAFYFGVAIGFALYAPHLNFFWTIFQGAAIALWLVLSFWIALFLFLANRCEKRFGPAATMLLIPFLWTGLEYFRSELYYLRFSWLNVGFAFQPPVTSVLGMLGVYGIGFFLAGFASVANGLRLKNAFALLAIAALPLAIIQNVVSDAKPLATSEPTVAGVQLEFPDEKSVLIALDNLVAQYPSAQIFMLSEYTFLEPIPKTIQNWCKENQRYLVVGGKEAAGTKFYNTAFVIGPSGEIEFQQAKSVPIQFFDDGLPAREQKLWQSPWGKIGICVCYDLSYRRVVDSLIRQGAEAILVPTMDVIDWGERQHQLHARVAPMRAAEFAVPVYRVCSSGISQFVNNKGVVLASAPFPGESATLSGALYLSGRGRLPLDHWLAPFSVLTTGVTILILAIIRFRRPKLPLTNAPVSGVNASTNK